MSVDAAVMHGRHQKQQLLVSPEGFQPRGLSRQPGFRGSLLFGTRRAVDLQTSSIYRVLRRVLPKCTGTFLDIGCGASPYQSLLPKTTTYVGIDVPRATDFGYGTNVAMLFDGDRIPLADGSVRTVLLTEVLEHVSDPTKLTEEILRVLEPNGRLYVTVPWSARFHFQPWDYVRYTPTKLAEVFSKFDIVTLEARGTDWSAVGSKLMVMWVRSIVGQGSDRAFGKWGRRVVAAVASPVAGAGLLAGHAGVFWNAGSTDDPLGYYLECRKPANSAFSSFADRSK